MTTTEMGSVQSPAATNTGGQNTVTMPPEGRLERSALASVFGQLEATADETTTPTPTDAATVTQDATVPQTDLGSTVGPEPDAAETAESAGDDGNDLSQQSQESTTQDPEVQKHLTELSEALARGEISIGELKRINKAVQKAKDAEGQLESLRAEVEALKTARTETPPASPVPGADAENPFANLKSDEDVRRMTREMHDLLDWAEDNPDGGVRRGKEFTAEEARMLRKEARRALDLHLPAQRERLAAEAQLAQQRQQAAAWMKQNFPTYTDPENATARRAKELLAQDPLLRRYPNADYLALALVKGDEALKAELAARNKPAVKPAPKPAVASAKPAAAVTSGGGQRAVGADAKLASAKAMVEKDRSRTALANYLAVAPGAAGRR